MPDVTGYREHWQPVRERLRCRWRAGQPEPGDDSVGPSVLAGADDGRLPLGNDLAGQRRDTRGDVNASLDADPGANSGCDTDTDANSHRHADTDRDGPVRRCDEHADRRILERRREREQPGQRCVPGTDGNADTVPEYYQPVNPVARQAARSPAAAAAQ